MMETLFIKKNQVHELSKKKRKTARVRKRLGVRKEGGEGKNGF